MCDILDCNPTNASPGTLSPQELSVSSKKPLDKPIHIDSGREQNKIRTLRSPYFTLYAHKELEQLILRTFSTLKSYTLRWRSLTTYTDLKKKIIFIFDLVDDPLELPGNPTRTHLSKTIFSRSVDGLSLSWGWWSLFKMDFKLKSRIGSDN